MPVQEDSCWPAAVVQAADPGTITVWVGTPSAPTALEDGGLVLLVEADPTQAQRCRSAWSARHDLVVCDQVLAAQSGAHLRWCLFNDPRLNGPLDEQAWHAHYPNLRQIGEEQRLGCSLADLLSTVGQHLIHGPYTGLSLHLQQGDPAAALDGLGAWVQGLQTVQLAMPAAATALWAAPVGAWLEPRGFRACEGESARWQRDAITSQRLLLEQRDQALAQVHDLEARLQQLSSEREALQAQSQGQQQQLENIFCELDAIQAMLDQQLA